MDDTKFQIFYEATARGLWSYVFRMTGDRDLTHDLTQDAFVRWIQNAKDVPETAQKAYVYRIATNLVYDHSRRKGLRLTSEATAENVPAPPLDTDIKMDLAQALEQLSGQNRALVWLAYAEEYSHQEIAEILDLRTSSIKVLLFRARKRLLEIINRLDLRSTP